MSKEYCLCKQAYDEHGPLMVECEICNDWYHAKCIDTSDEFVYNAPHFHCRRCIKENYKLFLQYLKHEVGERNFSDWQIVLQMYQTFTKKSASTKDVIGRHVYPVLQHFVEVPGEGYDITTVKGLINEGTNCWLNASLQVICGSMVRFLIVREEFRDDPVILLLEEAIRFLSERYGNHQPRVNNVPEFMVDLGQMLGMNPIDGVQKDSDEFYWTLIQHLHSKHPESDYDKTFYNTILNMKTCLRCSFVFGQSHEKTTFQVHIINSRTPIAVKDLLWNRCTGVYTLEKEVGIFCPNCRGTCKPGLHETQLFLENATVFVITINRSMQGTSVLNRSPVCVSQELDISDVCVTYEDNRACKYRLFATINHWGATFHVGHYTATLLDKEKAHTFDDKHITSKEKCKWLKEMNVMKHVHMLFYVRQLDIHALPKNTKAQPWLLDVKDKRLVEKIWFEEIPPNIYEPDTKDLQKCCGNESWVNERIVNSFISSVASESMEMNVRVYSSYFFLALTKGLQSAEYASCEQDRSILNADLLIFPVHKN